MLKSEKTQLLSPLGITIPEWACNMAPSMGHRREVRLAEEGVATIEVRSGEEASLVTASLAGTLDLTSDGYHDSVAALAWTVLSELSESSHPNVARMWSFLPGIHDDVEEWGIRYELFNKGRFTGFCRWFGSPRSFSTVLPAASAVGHDHNTLVMTAIGTSTAGLRFENPRQVPAFRYSKDHGVRPPCFARAVLVEFLDGPRLLVSGTASILREDSMHRGSIELQIEETFRNLVHLARSSSNTYGFSLEGVESARIYHTCASDQVWLMEVVRQRLPAAAAVEFVPAWLCRPELLVEIEMTIVPQRS